MRHETSRISTAVGPLHYYQYTDAASGLQVEGLVHGPVSGDSPVSVRLHDGPVRLPADLARPAPGLARKLRRIASTRRAVLVWLSGTDWAEAGAYGYAALAVWLQQLDIRQIVWLGSERGAAQLQNKGLLVRGPDDPCLYPVWARQARRLRAKAEHVPVRGVM